MGEYTDRAKDAFISRVKYSSCHKGFVVSVYSIYGREKTVLIRYHATTTVSRQYITPSQQYTTLINNEDDALCILNILSLFIIFRTKYSQHRNEKGIHRLKRVKDEKRFLIQKKKVSTVYRDCKTILMGTIFFL